MLKKLRRKFTLLTTTISVVALIIILLAINITNYTSMLASSDEIIVALTENGLRLPFGPPDRSPKEFAYTTRYFSVMTDKDGNIDFIDTKNISSVSPEDAIAYTTLIGESAVNNGTIDNFRYSVTNNGVGYTYMFLDIEEELMSVSAYIFYSLLTLLIATVVIFVLSFIVSKYAVSPIVKSYERQKRFITDVSHEFKTPLAIIKANNEVLQLDYGKSEWKDSIDKQVGRLTLLVESLVALTRTDEEQNGIIKTTFSLSDALLETVNSFEAPFTSAKLKTDFNIEKNLSYFGDETALRKLFEILIENAVKYSPENTTIRISLLSNAGKPILVVKNECVGVVPGKHDNWFDRFYREDMARTGEGFGIGLCIAKNICEKHKAKISVKSTHNNTVIVTVIF